MRVSLLTCLAVLVVAGSFMPAAADSWMAPTPKIASSEDGRWYVIVRPKPKFRGSEFLLVKRAEGQPARVGPLPESAATGVSLPKGDKLVARGDCKTPVKIRCLNGGKGFLLFERYGAVGSGDSIQVRDGAGKVRFSRRLTALFGPERLKTFSSTVSSVWWYEALWIDEVTQDIVVIWRGGKGGGVLRVALGDGKHRDAPATDILTRIGRGAAAEQIAALEQALEFKLAGAQEAVGQAFERSTTPPLARVHFAKYLLEQGDDRGKGYLAAGASSKELEVRQFAVQHLPLALGVGALPMLKAAMRDENRHVRNSAEFALRHMGRAAVPTLIDMISDESASEIYRAGAATALWNMETEHMLDAREALLKASESKLQKLAYAAKHASAKLRAYKPKPWIK
jgi:hypothetical protein